jgi:hypothetical protein
MWRNTIRPLEAGELIFEVTDDDGSFVAECLTENIVTPGDSWEELREMVKDAVRCYFFDSVAPRKVRRHFRRDEILELN